MSHYATPKADDVRALRARHNITGDHFAAILDVSRASVARWEAGEQPMPGLLYQFARQYLREAPALTMATDIDMARANGCVLFCGQPMKPKTVAADYLADEGTCEIGSLNHDPYWFRVTTGKSNFYVYWRKADNERWSYVGPLTEWPRNIQVED